MGARNYRKFAGTLWPGRRAAVWAPGGLASRAVQQEHNGNAPSRLVDNGSQSRDCSAIQSPQSGRPMAMSLGMGRDNVETRTMAILQDQTSLQAQIDALVAENARLKAKAAGRAPSLSMKVSAKGALSIYGMGRWPVTLYKGQWPKLLDLKEDILQFIIDHDDELKGKDDE